MKVKTLILILHPLQSLSSYASVLKPTWVGGFSDVDHDSWQGGEFKTDLSLFLKGQLYVELNQDGIDQAIAVSCF
ncbi:hypothetical protein K1719_026660 [Acacia pycnantha]|nr:hypothetical protein K1719_026660 [Acacia pycnantha]